MKRKNEMSIIELHESGRNINSIARELDIHVDAIKLVLETHKSRLKKDTPCEHEKVEMSGRVTDIFKGCRAFFQLRCKEECGYVGEMKWG